MNWLLHTLAGGGVLMARTLLAGFDRPGDLYETLLLVGGGSALGCAAAGWQKHPRRNLGLVGPAPFAPGAAPYLRAARWHW